MPKPIVYDEATLKKIEKARQALPRDQRAPSAIGGLRERTRRSAVLPVSISGERLTASRAGL